MTAFKWKRKKYRRLNAGIKKNQAYFTLDPSNLNLAKEMIERIERDNELRMQVVNGFNIFQ